MPRGRHRQSSALLRISVLAAALAPALVAVSLVAIGGSTGVLRVAALCAVVSTAAVAALLRQSRLGYGKELAQIRRERERLSEQAGKARAANAEALTRITTRERELATARDRVTGLRAQAKEIGIRADEAEARAVKLEARAAKLETRATEWESRAAELETLANDLEARTRELPARPVRLTPGLFASAAATLMNLERASARRNAPTEAAPPAPSVPTIPAQPTPVELIRKADNEDRGDTGATAPAPHRPDDATPDTPVIPGVRHRPIAVEGLVPAYAASMFGAALPTPAAAREPDTRDRPTAPDLLPVLRPAAEVAVREPADADDTALDLGIDALEPAVTALPADDAVARVVRDVADTVRATNRRISRAETGSSFDFFGRRIAAAGPGADTPDTPVESVGDAAARSAAESGAEPATETANPAAQPAAQPTTYRPVRVLLTHEPGTGRALPVDLTAHDDTEQLPKIIDTRRHA